MIKSTTQQGPSGCAPACVAQILGIPYMKAVRLFKGGMVKEIYRGFYCREIVAVLKKRGIGSEFKYVNKKIVKKIYKNRTIIYIKRSKKYPQGHFLCRSNGMWMDPWINMPKMNPAKSGFRRKLPGKPMYVVLSDLQ